MRSIAVLIAQKYDASIWFGFKLNTGKRNMFNFKPYILQ